MLRILNSRFALEHRYRNVFQNHDVHRGPPTVGPGTVADMKLSEVMRNHTDLKQMNKNARYTKKAIEHYSKLADRCVKNCHVVDLYCCCLDQIGLHEFIVCAERTGGKVVLGDSFGQSVFKDSFKRIFKKDANGNLEMGFAATLEILTSREVSVLGAIGACTSLNKKAPYVADTDIGQGGTACPLPVSISTTELFEISILTRIRSHRPIDHIQFVNVSTFQRRLSHASHYSRTSVAS